MCKAILRSSAYVIIVVSGLGYLVVITSILINFIFDSIRKIDLFKKLIFAVIVYINVF